MTSLELLRRWKMLEMAQPLSFYRSGYGVVSRGVFGEGLEVDVVDGAAGEGDWLAGGFSEGIFGEFESGIGEMLWRDCQVKSRGGFADEAGGIGFNQGGLSIA